MEIAFTVVLVYQLSVITLLLLFYRMKNYQLPTVRLNSPVDLALKDHLLIITPIQHDNLREYWGAEPNK